MPWRCRLWFGVLAAFAGSAAASFGQTSDYSAPCECGVSCLARPSDSARYFGYYVGGGSPFHGDERLPYEGIWGWDYGGFHFVPRVDLLWNHGRRYQGGTGAYRVDGTRFIEEHKEKKGE